MDRQMFCFQCEQTAGGSGCKGKFGVCGKNAELFEKCIRGTDPFFGKLWNYDGRYIDNTDFIQVMTYFMGL